MKIFFNTLVFVTIFGLVLILAPVVVTGQSIFSPSTDTIGLSQSPRFPEPNETITLSVVSRVINLNNKQTVWQIDGETVSSGTGVLEIDVELGGSGETTQVDFRVIVEGEVVQRTANLSPVDVNLVWEAIESYTPPFYGGKALNPGWGKIRITALPHVYREDGQLYDAQNLIYKWEYNGLVHGDDSGRGKDSFLINTVPRRGNRVTVEIETLDGNMVARRSVGLPISEPEIVLYPYNILFGPQGNLALDNTQELNTDEEIELIAYPYFYLTDSDVADFIEYHWRMNGESLTPPEDKNIIRLRRQSGVSGEARIDVRVQDTSSIFSTKSAGVNLQF
ncbi:MAG: hypothetical protein WD335_00325 [Candidatus Paceibacterota bacterium]